MSATGQLQHHVKVISRQDSCRYYAQSVNPQWVRLLKLLQMGARYERCIGAELFTPSLLIAREQINEFVTAVAEVVELAHSPGTFWTEALGLARRAANI